MHIEIGHVNANATDAIFTKWPISHIHEQSETIMLTKMTPSYLLTMLLSVFARKLDYYLNNHLRFLCDA